MDEYKNKNTYIYINNGRLPTPYSYGTGFVLTVLASSEKWNWNFRTHCMFPHAAQISVRARQHGPPIYYETTEFSLKMQINNK